MTYQNLNSFLRWALSELQRACFDAYPSGNLVYVKGGYRDEPIYTKDGVDRYIESNITHSLE